MAGLQRSEVSFRRQGSSGFVWDDRFLSGELNKLNNQQQEEEQNKSQKKSNESTNTVQRSRSNGGVRGYRSGKVTPAIEPSSPKLSACGFCGAFGNKNGGKSQRSKPGKRRSSEALVIRFKEDLSMIEGDDQEHPSKLGLQR